MRVKATREGLVGKRTATGWVIDVTTPFVALPSVRALHRCVRLTNPENGKTCTATVLDVGPWNTEDDAYVFDGARPAAERGISVSGCGTNSAGIDLGECVWHALALTDNAMVDWEFV